MGSVPPKDPASAVGIPHGEKTNTALGWGCSSVVEHLPRIHEALDWSLNTKKQNKTKQSAPTSVSLNPQIQPITG
jgi:hypothetical protein